MIWCPHMSSPSLSPPRASGKYDGGLLDSIPPRSAKTVEAGPHIPSYLYMASKQECVSPGIALFWHRAIVALVGCAPLKGTTKDAEPDVGALTGILNLIWRQQHRH